MVLRQSIEKRSMLQVQLTFTSAPTLKSERGLKLNVEIYAALANLFSPVD